MGEGQRARGLSRHILVSLPKQEHSMNTKLDHESRELTSDELNAVSGGTDPLRNKDEDLRDQDKLGTFEIQGLMSN